MCEELKKELSIEDLPPQDFHSVRDVVCWLAGLPIGSLKDFDQQHPNVRCRARIERSIRSAKLWIDVFDCLERDPTSEDGLMDRIIDGFSRKLWFKDTNHRKRRIGWLRTIGTDLCNERGSTPAKMREEWSDVVEYESNRAQWIREAGLQLATALSSLTNDESQPSEVRSLVAKVELGKLGYRIDVKNEVLFALEHKDARGMKGVALWFDRPEYGPVEVSSSLGFKSTELERVFITEPDRVRDEWINDKLEHPFWQLDFCLAYLKYEGDLQQLHSLTKDYAEISVYSLIRYPIENFDLEHDDKSIIQRAEELFRKGKLEAWGVRAGANRLEQVPVAEWTILEIFFDWPNGQAYLGTPSVPHTMRWDNVVVKRQTIVSLHQEISTTSSAVKSRQLPIASSTGAALKVARQLLIEVFETEDPATNRKADVIAKIVKQSGSTKTQVTKLWPAALLEIDETLRDAWMKRGPRKKNSTPDSNGQ